MGLFRIFPAAAGIIALTATVGFARDLRDCKDGEVCRTTISDSAAADNGEDLSKRSLPAAGADPGSGVYRVAITHGISSWLVSVDAHTGKVLDKRNI